MMEGIKHSKTEQLPNIQFLSLHGNQLTRFEMLTHYMQTKHLSGLTKLLQFLQILKDRSFTTLLKSKTFLFSAHIPNKCYSHMGTITSRGFMARFNSWADL